jgi:hypothetical protein
MDRRFALAQQLDPALVKAQVPRYSEDDTSCTRLLEHPWQWTCGRPATLTDAAKAALSSHYSKKATSYPRAFVRNMSFTSNNRPPPSGTKHHNMGVTMTFEEPRGDGTDCRCRYYGEIQEIITYCFLGDAALQIMFDVHWYRTVRPHPRCQQVLRVYSPQQGKSLDKAQTWIAASLVDFQIFLVSDGYQPADRSMCIISRHPAAEQLPPDVDDAPGEATVLEYLQAQLGTAE